MSTPETNLEAIAEPASPSTLPESLGWQLRAALPPMRLYSVSIFDFFGQVVWLSEGALGPDEQSFVAQALEELRAPSVSAQCETVFEDGRGAVFLAVRSPRSELCGVVMILVDGRALAAGLATRVATPSVRAVLEQLAAVLGPPPPLAGDTGPAPASDLDPVDSDSDSGIPAQSLGDPDEITLELEDPRAIEEILTLEVLPPAEQRGLPAEAGTAEAEAEAEATLLATRDLAVRELARLRTGGRTRWFHIGARRPDGWDIEQATAEQATAEGDPASADVQVRTFLARLGAAAAWLDAHRERQRHATLEFSIPVPIAALEAEDLPRWIAERLAAPRRLEGLGLEIAEVHCLRHRSRVARLALLMEQLGGFLVVDDFTLDSGALEILRSKALRLIKLDARLVGAISTDKLAEARIVAISHAAKVLGIECAAKGVDTSQIRRWLTAAGFEFAEGALFDAPQPLEALGRELAEAN